ncbi:MAG TPA: AraC family transcriptional regulator [Sphaerochaeta sp.]|nr:AraC family transcriptional regulator [Sphaerochaeta sp.]
MDTAVLQESTYFHEPTVPVKVIKRDPELPYRLHSHQFHELVLIVSGRGTTFTPTRKYPLAEASLFYMPPGVEHGYQDVEDLVLYNIIWGADFIKAQLLDLPEVPGYTSVFETGELVLLHLSPSEFAELLPIVQHLEGETDDLSYGSGSRMLAFSLLLELLVIISRIFDQTPSDANRNIRQLWEVIAYMEEHLDMPLSTEELTEIAAMSPSTLHRTFKQATGLAPIQYHLHKRIARACTLIQQRGLSMAEVGEACGFSDANYFSRQFKQVMGISPKQYQRVFANRFT